MKALLSLATWTTIQHANYFTLLAVLVLEVKFFQAQVLSPTKGNLRDVSEREQGMRSRDIILQVLLSIYSSVAFSLWLRTIFYIFTHVYHFLMEN